MATFERDGLSQQGSSAFSDVPHGDAHDLLQIDTPEQVELEFRVAGLGSRFVAILLDQLIIGAVYFGLFLLFVLVVSVAGATGKLDSMGMWFVAVVVLVVFAMTWGYFAYFEAWWHGQTPGKRAMKLRVIKDSGRQITLFEALARNLLRFVDYLPGFYAVGVISMLCNRHNKRLGDLVAGTLVVHERVEEQPLLFQSSLNLTQSLVAPTHEPWQQPVPSMFPADAVARLKGQDLLTIETFFSRMLDLPLETRAAIAYRMAGQMAAKMGVALPEGNPERALESMAYQMRSSR